MAFRRKALALLSGGLDSTLAVKVIKEQDIDVEAVNFFSPFCVCSGSNSCGSEARRMSSVLGIKVRTIPEGLVVRPLSAKLLPETIPEQCGWIDREKLLAISGRSRKAQIGLAQYFEIRDYHCPAGGCLLTDPIFAAKVRDLIDHGSFTLHEVKLLKVGRHFRLSPHAKLIVGRNEIENQKLAQLRRTEDMWFTSLDVPGPSAIGRGHFTSQEVTIGCRIVGRYSDSKQERVRVFCGHGGLELALVLEVKPLDNGLVNRLRVPRGQQQALATKKPRAMTTHKNCNPFTVGSKQRLPALDPMKEGSK